MRLPHRLTFTCLAAFIALVALPAQAAPNAPKPAAASAAKASPTKVAEKKAPAKAAPANNAVAKKAAATDAAPVTQPWAPRVEVGLFGGWFMIDEKVGLGNAFHAQNVPADAPIFGLRAGYTFTKDIAAELELGSAASHFRRNENVPVPLFGYRVAGRYGFLSDGMISPFVTLGVGQYALFKETETINVDMTTQEIITDSGKCAAAGEHCRAFEVIKGGEADDGIKDGDADFFVQVGAGAAIKLGYRLSARVDLRWLATDRRRADPGEQSGSFSNNFEATAGLSWGFGGAAEDSDGDGIPEDKDACPTQPEDKDGFQDEDGCPDPDNDGDGIPDVDDKCPNVKEDKDGFQDDDGCPDLDNDGDGIPDAADKCPLKAEDRDGFQDEDGCPDLDNDGDGIPDKTDKCPNVKEDKDNFQDGDGCPEPDNDGDGIPDTADKCPNKAETPNSFQDKDGCPDEMPKDILALFSGPAKGVTFKRGKLAKTAAPTFDKLLELMLEHDDVKIEVHVHADGRGDADKHMAESKARGALITGYFNDAGIDPSRLIIVPHGNSQPLSAGKSRKAKEANNRVELKFYDPSKKK